MGQSAVDNDILIKLSRYALLNSPAFRELAGGESAGVLGAARYVVAGRLRKQAPTDSLAAALDEFDAFLATAEVLEPSEDEVEKAALLEDRAQALGFALDAGESQLVAIVCTRGLSNLITGDKRALAALEDVLPPVFGQPESRGVAICLEQVMLGLLKELGVAYCRDKVCADHSADRALTACFGCSLGHADEDSVLEGLNSYIHHLRQTCASILSA